MAFNINAHVILQGPKNIKAVTNSIKQQLAGISVPVNLQTGQVSSASSQITTLNKGMKQLQASAASTSKSLKNVGVATTATAGGFSKAGAATGKLSQNLRAATAQTQKAVGAMQMLGRETALTFKRFAAAGIVTATVFRLGGAIAEATGNALEFQREMVKLEQVTGRTATQLGGLRNAIAGTSKELGISANELANIARLFSQTGQSIREVEASMKAIARSSLAPTFGDMEQTAEGLIAALAQFGIRASDAEKVLGSMNKVSKKFAVESQDLIAAVRRAGGVFATAAGQFKDPIQSLNEFNAVFTAVRSTTRESAETIATGLRTIFTRLQRRGTIDMLKGLGIELTNTEGKFIGLYESFRVLSKELDRIVQKGDAVTLSAITEELGGMRQVGKLIPAIREFQKAERALAVGAQGAIEGLGSDVKKGLTPLVKQFEILGARFDDFIRKIADSSTFQNLAKFAIDTANAFITLGESLAPILPLLTQLAAMKIAKGAFAFGQGFFGSTKGMGGAGGLGARVGGVVAGKPSPGAASSASALATNSASLNKNNTALNALSKAITNNFTQSSKRLVSAMDRLGKAVSAAPRGAARGPRRGFSAGGLVPGRGNRDTVPAMLTPGEFVINKGSTNAIGAENLASMNRYAGGGKVRRTRNRYGTIKDLRTSKRPKFQGKTDIEGVGMMREVDVLTPQEQKLFESQLAGIAGDGPDTYGGAFLSPMGMGKDIVGRLNKGEIKKELEKNKDYRILRLSSDPEAKKLDKKVQATAAKDTLFSLKARSLEAEVSESIEEQIYQSVISAMNKGSKHLQSDTRAESLSQPEQVAIMENANIDNIIGNIFEMILLRSGAPYSEKDRDAANAPFDFPAGLGSIAQNFGTGLTKPPTDAKTRYTSGNIKTFLTKVKNQKAADFLAEATPIMARIGAEIREGGTGGFSKQVPKDDTYGKGYAKEFKTGKLKGVKDQMANPKSRFNPQRVNTGGSIRGTGTDTVPALLTPGEFVINKSSAQSIGYGNLREMNRYAAGGVVRRGKGRYGTMPPPANTSLNRGAMGGMSALGEAAMSTAFALMMLDFSTMEGAIMSIVMLGTALPSVIASFKMLPTLINGLATSSAMQAFSKYSTAATNAAGSAAPLALGRSAAAAAPFGKTMIGGIMTGVMGNAAGSGVGSAAGTLGGSLLSESFKEGLKTLKQGLLNAAPKIGIAMGATLGATAGVLIGGYVGREIGEMLAGSKVKGRVEGVEGYVGGASAAKTAVASEAAGSMVGVAGIAGAIALFNPMMAGLTLLIGGLYTATKALSDWYIALARQAEFEAFERLGKSVDNATEALDKFIQVGSGASSRQINALTTRIDKVFKDQATAANLSYEAAGMERKAGLEGTGTGAMVGGALGAIVGTIATVLTGGFAAPTVAIFAGIGATIGAAVEKMGDFFDFTGSGRQADTLETANKQLEALTEEFVAKMNEAFGKMVESFIGQADFMSGNQTLPKMAALITVLDTGEPTLDEAQASFRALQGVLEDTGKQGKALSKFMEQKLFVGLQDSMKAQSDLVKSTFGGAMSLGLDPTNIEELRDNFGALREVTGHNNDEMNHTLDIMGNLVRIQTENNVQMLAQAARQEMMNRVLKKGTVIVDMFVIAIERLAKAGQEASSRFKMAADDLSGFAAKTMAGGGGGIQISDRGMINPFDNLETSTQEAIDSGIQRVGNMSGMNTSGMSEMIRVQQILPDLLQNVARVAEKANDGQIATREQLLTILKDELGKLGVIFEDLPPAIQSSLRAGLDISAGRQGQESITLKGALEGEDFQGLMSRFGEASEKARAALAGFYTSITNAQKSLISIVNESIKLEQSRIDASLKALDIIQRTNSAMERFSSNTDYIARANRNLFDKLSAIGSGATSLNAAQQQQNVENLRQENANLRSQLGSAGLPDPNTNAAELQSQLESGELAGFDATTRDLIDRLVENEKAIERETKALEALTEDTSRLEAVNQTLADIQKAQMTAEQQAKYFMNQMSRVEGESDPIRRGQMLREIMLPFASFSKAMSGGTLSMQEFNAMMSNFDSQIAPILRSQGASEQDIESARQGFFAKFASEFPAVFNQAVSSSFLAVEGPMQGILQAISQSMAPAGKPFEDLSKVDFPALFKPAMDEFGAQMGSTVKGIMEAAKQIAQDQAAAVVQEQKDRASRVEEAIKKQIGALEKDTESIDAHKAALNLANTELGTFKTRLEEAGKKANDLMDIQNKEAVENEKAAQAATDAEDERGKIVAVKRKETTEAVPFTMDDAIDDTIKSQLMEQYDAGTLDTSAVRKLAELTGVSLTGSASAGTGAPGQQYTKGIPELLDNIFGAYGVPGFGADLSEFDNATDMLNKVNQAGLMKTPERERTEIDFKRIDESKLDQGLEAYEKGYLERLKKQSLASDKAWKARLDQITYSEGGDKDLNKTGVLFDRILDELVEMGRITAEAAAKARAAEKNQFGIERVGGGRLQKRDLLEAQARVGRERLEQKNNESRGGNVNRVYQELRKMGKDEAADKLLMDLNTETQAQLDTASNTSQAVAVLKEIRDQENGKKANDDASPRTFKDQASDNAGAVASLGGYLTGPSHSQGGIKLEAEGGEYIIKKQSVAKLGKQRLDYINSTGTLPKFQAGGPVGAGFTSGGIGMNVSSINSMQDLMALVDQLGPLSGPIEFMQMLQQMDQFSGGNGMQAILNSPMMGEIMQKLQQKQIDHFTKLYGMGGAQGAIQQQAFGIGGSSPREQLDKEFQNRLGGITGGLDSKRGQQLNNLLQKFSDLAGRSGGVDAAAGTSGGARLLTNIERMLSKFGMAPDAIEETMKMYKSLLQDEDKQKKQEIKLLKDMGIYEKPKKFKPQAGAQNPMMGPIMGMLGMGNMMPLQGKMGGGMVMPGMGGIPGMSGMGPAILGGMAGQTAGFQHMFNTPLKQFLQSIGMGGMGGMMGQHNLGAGGLGGGLGILGGMNPIGFNPNLIPGGGNRALQMGGGRGGMLGGMLGGGGGGLCDCFTAAIDKLIAFLAGEEVSIGGGAGGGAGGPIDLNKFLEYLKNAWEGLKTFGGTLLDTAIGIGKPIVDAFKDTFGGTIFGTVAEGLAAGIKPIVDGIANTGQAIWDGLSSTFEIMGQGQAAAGAAAEEAGIALQKEKTRNSLIDRLNKAIQKQKVILEGAKETGDTEAIKAAQEKILELETKRAKLTGSSGYPGFDSLLSSVGPALQGFGSFLGGGGLGSLFGGGGMGGFQNIDPQLIPRGKVEIPKIGPASGGVSPDGVTGFQYKPTPEDKEAAAAALGMTVAELEAMQAANQNVDPVSTGGPRTTTSGEKDAFNAAQEEARKAEAAAAAGNATAATNAILSGKPVGQIMQIGQPGPSSKLTEEDNKARLQSIKDMPARPGDPIYNYAVRGDSQSGFTTGISNYQGMPGTEQGMRERIARMRRNKEKIDAQLARAKAAREKKGLGEFEEGGYFDRRSAQSEAIGKTIADMERRLGIGPESSPAKAKQKAQAKQQAQAQAAPNQQLANQLSKNMGINQRKVKLTDTPLAAAEKIIQFLKNACLMVKACSVTAPTPPGGGGGGDQTWPMFPSPGPGQAIPLPADPPEDYIPWDGTLGRKPFPNKPPINAEDFFGRDPQPAKIPPNPLSILLGGLGGGIKPFMPGGLGAGIGGALKPFMPGGATTLPFFPGTHPDYPGSKSGGATTMELRSPRPADFVSELLESLGSGTVGAGVHPEAMATTPLLSDETAFIAAIDNLRGIFEGGGTVFSNFDLVVKGMKEAANLIPKIPEEIKLTLQTPEVTVKVMASDVQNQIGKVVQAAIDSAIARKFGDRIQALENKVNNDGMGPTGL